MASSVMYMACMREKKRGCMSPSFPPPFVTSLTPHPFLIPLPSMVLQLSCMSLTVRMTIGNVVCILVCVCLTSFRPWENGGGSVLCNHTGFILAWVVYNPLFRCCIFFLFVRSCPCLCLSPFALSPRKMKKNKGLWERRVQTHRHATYLIISSYISHKHVHNNNNPIT